MAWDESQHPRAPNGKFGAGSGGSGQPAGKGAGKQAAAAAKAKIADAKVKAKGAAKAIVDSAKVKAAQIKWKGAHDVAKATAALKAGKVADPKAARAQIKEIKATAKAKAAAVIAKAREKAKAKSAQIVAKAGAAPSAGKSAPGVPSKSPSLPPAKPAQPPRVMTDSDLEGARTHIERVANAYELSAALTYSGHSYSQINASLRTGKFEQDGELTQNELHATVGHLDNLMTKSKNETPIITYRGSAPHPSFSNLKPGEMFVDKAFVSTTSDPHASFDGGVVFHITSPPGTKIAGIPSKFPEEKEMLLGRGTAFRVDRIEAGQDSQGNPAKVFHVTVVGQH